MNLPPGRLQQLVTEKEKSCPQVDADADTANSHPGSPSEVPFVMEAAHGCGNVQSATVNRTLRKPCPTPMPTRRLASSCDHLLATSSKCRGPARPTDAHHPVNITSVCGGKQLHRPTRESLPTMHVTSLWWSLPKRWHFSNLGACVSRFGSDDDVTD